MNAAKITEIKEPLQIQKVNRPASKNEEVFVRVESAEYVIVISICVTVDMLVRKESL